MQERGLLASARRGWGLGCAAQGCVLAMLPIFVGMGVVVVSLFDVPQRSMPVVLLAAFVGWALSALVLVAGTMGWIVRRRNRSLDEAFATIGLLPIPMGIVNRGYRGPVSGRTVHAWFSKGPSLEIYVNARSGRRLGMGGSHKLERGLGAMLSKEPRPVGEDVNVWTDDGEWTDAWLQESGVTDRIIALCTDLPGARQQVIVTPDSVKLHVRYFMMNDRTGQSDITTSRLGQWLSHLIVLARSLEAQPTGDQTASPLEQDLRTDRRKIARRGTLWVIGFCLLMCIVVAGALLVALLSS